MRISGLVALVVCVVACTAQDPGPPMPTYGTEAGRTCASACQAKASSCRLGCGQLMRGATTSRQRSQCVDDCNAPLADCYSACE